MTWFLAGVLSGLLALAPAPAPPDTAALRPVPGIRDPVFAILVGLAFDHHAGRVDAARLATAIRATGRPTKLPLELLAGVTRLPAPEDSTVIRVEARFTRALDLPVPYKILVYHPGSFRGSERLLLEERALGAVTLHHDERVDGKWVARRLALTDVHLYRRLEGELAIDIDGWLDSLAGDKLDDTWVDGLVVFRMDGALYGMAIGHNRSGDGRSGTLAFADDRLIYPNTAALKTVARAFRAQIERLAPALQPGPALADPK